METLKESWYLYVKAVKHLFNYKELGMTSLHGQVLSTEWIRNWKGHVVHKSIVLPSPFMSQILWHGGEFLATDGGIIVYSIDDGGVKEGDYVEADGMVVWNKAFKKAPRIQINAYGIKKLGNVVDEKV